MKFLYIESSAVGRAFLHGDRHTYSAMRAAMRGCPAVTSRLTFAETDRAFARAAAEGLLTPAQAAEGRRKVRAFLRRCHAMELDEAVVKRAGEPFPVEPVRTLAGLHLATILEWERAVGGDLVVCTRDGRVGENASALGFSAV